MNANPLSTLDAAALERWLRRSAQLITEHAAELTALDGEIGDADHGQNMKRGLQAVVELLDADGPAAGGSLSTPEALLKKVGMTLVSTVGGASGPLYGTFFLRAAGALKDADTADAAPLAAALRAGMEGIAQRGKSSPGEKTMLDAWAPALEAMEQAENSLAAAVRAGADAAAAGRDATADMVATKGRASYLGERSRGHIDPGAASTALLWQALAETVEAGATGGDAA
ncbi:dihydroxyacetone kinase subunit L [Brachybacterium sp. EF45031]|uniref:dihydroxyacetone kinase subunit DhaL n=1 Tax=Brachybacterium sillae TaxID=2810536 RepID=UPI00217E58D1|nr:dihydroxyacetone kinase subunit DhaL [Brachybacterium sillae]MCS6711957.1 dihydroxyacetone kinase subunit L [Brachybacterium sillae]